MKFSSGPIDPETGDLIPPKYQPSDFFVAPSDSRGVSHRLTFRVAPDLVRAIDQILQSNRFPLTSRGDILRFFVREGIRLIESMEPVVSVTKRIDMLSMILGEETSHAEFLHVFDKLQETVSRYVSDNAPQQAIRVLALAKHQFESMPDGHWRSRYLTELDARFHTLLATSGSAGVTLTGGNGSNGQGGTL